jgi:hypothetical protein
MENRLQLPDDNIADTNKDGIAVVHSTVYEGMDQCMGSVTGQRSADGAQLSKLVETTTRDAVNVTHHRQLRVKDDAKVTHGIKREHVSTANT